MDKTCLTNPIPVIKIETCNDDVYEERENANTLQILPEEDESIGKIIAIRKSFSFNNGDHASNTDTLPKKMPRRKNGLGILTGYAGRPKNNIDRIGNGLSPDTSLSSGCMKEALPNRMSPDSFLSPRKSRDEQSPSRLVPVSSSPDTGLDGSGQASCELQELKETTARLNLPTRRPSFVAWHDRYIKRPLFMSRTYTIHEAEETGNLLSTEQRSRIDENLEGIKADLMEMRSMDKHLAKNLLSLRREINKLKLEMSCQEHEDLLEDAQDELEALQELSEMCDYPLDELNFGETLRPLKNIGVTRLNLSARRFSTC